MKVFTFVFTFLVLEFNQERRVGLSFLQSGVWTSRALPWLPCTGSTWVTTLSWLPLPEQFLSAPLGLGNSQVPSFTLHSDSVSIAVAKPLQNVAASHNHHLILLVTLGAVVQLWAWLSCPWLTSLRCLQ